MVGGGTGERFGSAKQYERIGDVRIIDLARATAEACSDGVVVVVPAADVEREHGVAGGATRSASVRNGLAAVPADADIICVHDAARPLATSDLFRSVIEAVAEGADGAVPGVPVTDTIKIVDRDGSTAHSDVDARARVARRGPDPAGVPRRDAARGARVR